MKSSSFLRNMTTFIFIGGVVVGVVTIMAMLTLLRTRFQALIKAKLNGTLNKVFFNGKIKAQTVSYMKTSIAFSTSLQFMNFNRPLKELWPELIVPFLLVVVYPFVCLYIVVKFRGKLDTPRFTKRISNMYEGVDLKRNKATVLYYPFYLLRRLLFVILPLLFWHHSTF